MLCLLLFQTSGTQLFANSASDEAAPFTVVVVTTDILCHGVCDGSALAVVTGGTAPFSFLWNTGDTVQHLDWEPAGYYEVTVTDADGDTAVAGGTINEPPPIVIDLQLTLNGGCNAGTTANAFASATGGTPGYTFEWSTGAWGQSITDLAPGNYWLTVTDANNCKEGLNFKVDPVNNGLQVDISVVSGDCGANNASATASATGGTAPYNYVWSNGANTAQIDNLSPGTYTCSVTDSGGCAGEETVVISPSGDLVVMAVARDISCGGSNDGAAQSMATGGTPPYSFLWSTGQTNSGIDNLSPGFYTVTINDSGGCSGSTTVEVKNRPGLVLDTSSTPSDCNASNGAATVVPTGGTPPFSYQWCDGQTIATAVGLPGSVCSVIVTDAAGCSATAVVTILENTDLTATITSQIDPDCGAANGSATAAGNNGTPPYTFLWCNGQTTPTVTNLAAGSCTVTVTDAEGCRATATATLTQKPNLDVTATPNYSDCDTPSTSATANINGGMQPFSYLWSDGQTTQTAINLAPGTYTVTVTDVNGCTGSDDVAVGDPPPPLMPDFTWKALECFDNDSMRVEFTATSNIQNTTCTWDFGNGQTAAGTTVTVVLVGSPHDVTLTKDLGNCSGDITKTVTLPYVDITLSGPDNGCVGDVLQVTAINNSSVPPNVTYDWFPDNLIVSGDSTSAVTVFSDTSGMFQICVAVMNDLGCLDTICTDYTVDPKTVLSVDSITYIQCDTLTIDFGGITDATWIFGDPTDPDAMSTDDNPSYTYPDTGTYKVTIIPDNPCIDTICKTVTVIPLKIDFECDLLECRDTCILNLTDISMVPGMITNWNWTVTDSAGNTVHTDTLQNPEFDFTISGTYTISMEIHFNDGCVRTISKDKEINCFDPPTIGSCTQTVCYGDTVKLNFAGADPDLIFTFPQDSCIVIDSLTGAVCFIAAKEDTVIVFPVTVTNSNGTCTGMTDYTITIPPKIEIEIMGDTIVCDSTPVELIVTGDGSYTYQWSESLSFDTIFSRNDTVYVVPGRPTTYYVRATDADGCTEIEEHTVGNYQVDIDIQGDPIICIGDSTLLVLVNGNSGDTLGITWSPNDIILSGQGTDSVWVMPADDTDISVATTNQFGCMETDTFQMQVNNANEGLEIHAEELDNGDEKTTIYAWQDSTQLFATEGYQTYKWDPESTLDPFDVSDPIAKPTTSTLYQLTVEDEEGCIGNAEILITVLTPPCGRPHVFLPNAFTPGNGDGRNLNDILYVRGNIIDEVHLMIYNRWGEKVFETFDQSRGWNGEFGDKGVCPDVYGYYLTVRCFNGEEYAEKGNITVLK